jgi:hypothetical protein
MLRMYCIDPFGVWRDGRILHVRILPVLLVSPASDQRYLRYFESRSFVRLMMNFDTNPPSSFNLTSLSNLSFSDASASRPFKILDSKFFLKSSLEPRYSGLAKLSRAKYSDRSFWMGVPVRMTLLWTFRAVRDWKVSVSGSQLGLRQMSDSLPAFFRR